MSTSIWSQVHTHSVERSATIAALTTELKSAVERGDLVGRTLAEARLETAELMRQSDVQVLAMRSEFELHS